MSDQNDNEESVFHKRIDIDALGMAGYSLGGGRMMRGQGGELRRREQCTSADIGVVALFGLTR